VCEAHGALARLRLLLAACLLPSLIAAGCGGDDDSGEGKAQSGTATISKPAYIARSDALCAEANKSLGGLNLGLATALRQGDFEGAASQVEAEVARVKPLFNELLNLPAPAGDEQQLDELNAARNQVLALVEQLVDAVRAQDVEQIRGVSQELAAAGQRSRQLSSAYGFKTCGQAESG
jgi:hypothetical protein